MKAKSEKKQNSCCLPCLYAGQYAVTVVIVFFFGIWSVAIKTLVALLGIWWRLQVSVWWIKRRKGWKLKQGEGDIFTLVPECFPCTTYEGGAVGLIQSDSSSKLHM